jgi:predicted alpha/beta-fold hydrolase
LPGGHLQTLYAYFSRAGIGFAYRRERWQTPDGDFIDLDWCDSATSDANLVVLFHGLEGSSRSQYAVHLMKAVQAIGWAGVVCNFRSCSGEMNRLARSYHSGDSAEGDWILRRLKSANPNRLIYAAGVSLGANMLLKWLGEQGGAAAQIIERGKQAQAQILVNGENSNTASIISGYASQIVARFSNAQVTQVQRIFLFEKKIDEGST